MKKRTLSYLHFCILSVVLFCFPTRVFNQSAPTLVGPSDMVVSCQFPFKMEDLLDINNPKFGKIVLDLQDRKKVSTLDKVCLSYCLVNPKTKYPGNEPNPMPGNFPASNRACDYFKTLFDSTHADRIYELVWGFDGYVLGHFVPPISVKITDERKCMQGRILRTFEVRDTGNIKVTTTQTIWVVNCDPFDVSDTDLKDTSFTVTNCKALDTIMNPGIIDSSKLHCSLISIQHFDEIFTVVPGACFEIERTWVIIDWCQYDPQTDPKIGRWEAKHTIRVIDNEGPQLNAKISSCNVIDSLSQPGTKLVDLDILAQYADNCTPSEFLTLEYKIDLNDDNTIDARVGPLTKREFDMGKTPQYQNNKYAFNNKNISDASGKYPVGNHTIIWTATDGCGNTVETKWPLLYKDLFAPQINCTKAAIIFGLPPSKELDIWAKDLPFMVVDNCTPKSSLKYYFDKDSSKEKIRITCLDFEKHGNQKEFTLHVTLTVEDQNGNKDHCEMVLVLQDNLNVCNTVNTKEATGFNSLQLVPNPFQNEFNLIWKSDLKIISLSLYNTQGQPLWKRQLDDTVHNFITISDLDIVKGVYFIQITTLQGIINKKVIRQ